MDRIDFSRRNGLTLKLVSLAALLATASIYGGCSPSVYHDRDRLKHQGERIAQAPIPFESSILHTCIKTQIPDSMYWPRRYSPTARDLLILALNISGSFEGHDGWATISDNFDGQGLSLGLLNQNLGTGSLQPLLIKMRDDHMPSLKKIFSEGNLNLLMQMLAHWQNMMEDVPERLSYSFQDVEPTVQHASPSDSAWVKADHANRASSAWALNHIYENGHFNASWKRQLTDLASSKEYVNYQTQAALALDKKTKTAMNRFGFQSVRAYLFLFDIFVQNGGLYESDFRDWTDLTRRVHPDHERESLAELLALRLRHVRPEYKSDVYSRKAAIIAGHGEVHGEARSLETEYCYDGDLTLE